ncbi:hypothetical protein BDF22DRAFT_740973 [Syncephalis plumigaleata]|nr:hypothetical protein BDF22DRAFT_740973 [Syncephalis plumigaleata]
MPLTSLVVSDKHDLSVLLNRSSSSSSSSPLMATSRHDHYDKQMMIYRSYSLDTAHLFKNSPAAAFIKKYAPKRGTTTDDDDDDDDDDGTHMIGRKKTRKSICYSMNNRILVDSTVSNTPMNYNKSSITPRTTSTTPLQVRTTNLPHHHEKGTSSPLHASNTSCYNDVVCRDTIDQHPTDNNNSDNDDDVSGPSTPDNVYSNKHQLSSGDVAEFKRSPQLKNDLQRHLRIEKCIRQLRSRLGLAIHKSSTGQCSKSFDELVAEQTTHHSPTCTQGVTRDATSCTAQVVEDAFGRCVLQPCRALVSTSSYITHTDACYSTQYSNADVPLSSCRSTTTTTDEEEEDEEEDEVGIMTMPWTTPSHLLQAHRHHHHHHVRHRKRRALNHVTPLIHRQPSRSACYKSATVAAYFATPCVALPPPGSPYESMLKRRTKKKTKEASLMMTKDKPSTSNSDNNSQSRSTSSVSHMKHLNNNSTIVTSNMSPLDCTAAAEAMLLLHQQDN